MEEINESRNSRIHDRIVTLADVRRLANVLVAKHEEIKADDSYSRIRFSATCFDDSRFDSKSADLFSPESQISSKSISGIELYYFSIKYNQEISISLNHGSSDYNNSVKVSGVDSTWVNGTLKMLEEIISSFKPQNNFFTKFKGVIHFVFSLSIGFVYFFVMDLIPTPSIEGKPPEWLIQLAKSLKGFELSFIFLKFLMAYSIGVWPAFPLIGKLEKLWPSIEFQIGPEHLYIEKKRRVWIATAILIGVVPLITSTTYDILKIFFKHFKG
jgi:hypothetical protein